MRFFGITFRSLSYEILHDNARLISATEMNDVVGMIVVY